MALAWLSPDEWRSLLEQAGFEVEACYGWFDRSPYMGREDTVWVARRLGLRAYSSPLSRSPGESS